MQLLKITARRIGHDLRPQSREIAGEAPDDPKYWDMVCDILLARMKRDGVIEQDNDTATSMAGQGNPVQEEVRKIV